MRRIWCGMLGAIALTGLALGGTVAAQDAPLAPPLEDTRISIHTLLREDLFAGLLTRDMGRFERGKANIARLEAIRPNQQPQLNAWRGLALLFEAELALEKGDAAGYGRLHRAAFDAFDKARAAGPQDIAVNATLVGAVMVSADRLAPKDRAAAWEAGYQASRALLAKQEAGIGALPEHIRSELAAALVQTAQRTGREAEAAERLEAMLPLVKGTAYQTAALAWKADATSRAGMNLGCQGCHERGRLAPTLARLAAAG